MMTNPLSALLILAVACTPALAQAIRQKSADVSPHIAVSGADPTGKLDTRVVIQRAIDTAAAAGGGVIFLRKGTYLLDSYQPSTHPWKFYNLRVPSNVTLDAEPGTVLLQGRGGRAPLPSRAERVENNVIAVGTANYQAVTFQDPRFNGGFRMAKATRVGTSTVSLLDPSDLSGFAAGDFIAIYASTAGDVIESEATEVTSIDRAAGILTLAHPLARSFPRAFVARVTNLATTHVSLRNLTIQGAIPLAATEVFDLSLSNCRLIYDGSAGGSNVVTGMMANTIRGFRMENGSIEAVGSAYAGLELPQRNSQDVEFENVTFRNRSVVFGEYAAHWKLLSNQLWIYPDSATPVGIAAGGLDVELTGNTIHAADLTAGSGSGALLTDCFGPADYLGYIGKIRFRGNTIECRADGNNCLRLTTRDPLVDGNRITAPGTASGIKIEGAGAEFVITHNTISVGTGPALVLNVSNLNSGVVKGNHLAGSGPYAIVLYGQFAPAAGERLAAGNTISGFSALFLNVNATSRRK